MKSNLATQILAGILSFGVFVPSSVYAEIAQTKAATDMNKELMRFAENYNHAAKNWASIQQSPTLMKKELKKMGVSFNPAYEAQDKAAFNRLVAESPELAMARVKGNTLEFMADGSTTAIFTMTVMGNNKFQINGKDFEYNVKEPFETNLARAKKMVTQPSAAFFLDNLFLPRAEAVDGVAIGAIVLGGLAILLACFAIFRQNSPKHADAIEDRLTPPAPPGRVWRHDND